MESPLQMVNMHSPNLSSWTYGEGAITHVVCHTPEGSWEGTHSTIMNPSAQVSYHVLINFEGTAATQFVPWTRKAWHALSWNSIAEGISLCCYTGKTSKEGEDAMAKMVAWRLRERGLPCKYDYSTSGKGFCRHGDLQADRSDPMTRWKFRTVFARRVKHWYRYYESDQLTDKRGYWAWKGWWCSNGPWQDKGRREMGDLHRPNVPKFIPPNWWIRLRVSGGCK